MHHQEGRYPMRSGAFDHIKMWRQSRPDLFPDLTSLLLEDGERWHRIRSIVQQDMMRPKSALYYVGQIEQVAEEFVNLIRVDLEKEGSDGVTFRYKVKALIFPWQTYVMHFAPGSQTTYPCNGQTP